MDRLLRLNAGWVAGLGLVIAGLVRYRSFAARVILDRWSYGHFGLIALAVLVLLLVLVGSWQKSRARGVRSGRSRGRDLVQIAAATWGLAYFLASIDRASNGGNISEFVFFGSSMPLAAILEWISMTLLLAAVGFLAAPHLRGHGAKAALAIGSIALLALMAEGLLRVKVALAPATQGFPTFSGQVWERRYVHLNRDGFRDVDHQLLAPARVHRLLIVGDSYAFGWGIRHIEGRLGEKIVAKLTSVTGMPWEAINGSQCDTHTLDHIRFVEETLRYGPETVLLVYVFNDMDYLTPVTVRDRIFTKSRLGGLDPRGDRLRPHETRAVPDVRGSLDPSACSHDLAGTGLRRPFAREPHGQLAGWASERARQSAGCRRRVHGAPRQPRGVIQAGAERGVRRGRQPVPPAGEPSGGRQGLPS